MNTVALFDQQDAFVSFTPGDVSDYPLELSNSGRARVTEVPSIPDYDPRTQDVRLTRDGWEVVPRVFPVPREVPAWRIKAQADKLGYTPAIEAFLTELPEAVRPYALRAWSDGNVVERHAPTTLAVAAHLNLTTEQVDEWFIEAAKISV